MNASRASLLAAGAAAASLVASPLFAQAANFDDKPTGFLTAQTGGMPADAWNGTSLGHRQAAGFGTAGRAAQPRACATCNSRCW